MKKYRMKNILRNVRVVKPALPQNYGEKIISKCEKYEPIELGFNVAFNRLGLYKKKRKAMRMLLK